MPLARTCILTDSSVIFSSPDFPGHSNVAVLPLGIQVGDQVFAGDALDPSLLPFKKSTHLPARSISPSVEQFCQAYMHLGSQYDTILVILLSFHFLDAVKNATEAVEKARVSAEIRIIDSQTIASGLGFLVQAAAEAISNGWTSAQIQAMIRNMIPHIYAMVCLPSLSNLARAGKMDPEQSLIAEMMNIIPLFTVESGRLLPVLKARSPRHVIDIFDEFVSEFKSPRQISIIQAEGNSESDMRNLKERLAQNQPGSLIHFQTMSPVLVNLFGSQSLAVFALERTDLI